MRSQSPKKRRRKSEATALHVVPGSALLTTEAGGRGEQEGESQPARVYQVSGRASLTRHSLSTVSDRTCLQNLTLMMSQ